MTAGYDIRLIHQQIIKTVMVRSHRTQNRCISAAASRSHDQHNRTRNRQTCTFNAKSFRSRGVECQRCRGTVDQMRMRNELLRNILFSKAVQFFYRTKICFLSHIFSSSFHKSEYLLPYAFSSSFSNNSARSKKHLLISESGFPSITVFP